MNKREIRHKKEEKKEKKKRHFIFSKIAIKYTKIELTNTVQQIVSKNILLQNS